MELKLLKELNKFLGEAASKTYAGGGPNLDPDKAENGMKELEYGNPKGEWYYKDSYAGFFQSWGREVVWHKGKPLWCQIYGGGMQKNFSNDKKFTHRTFDFLKKALSAGEKIDSFQPRGPKEYTEGHWKYECRMEGDITRFEGKEMIKYKNKIIFTHIFSGGLFGYGK